MDFYDIVDQIIDLLKQRGRVSYRALKVQFHLDNEALEALKEELLYAYSVVDDQGRGLVWTGNVEGTIGTPSPPPHSIPAPLPQDTALVQPTSPLGTSRTPEAERRQLTVMFIDLVESTSLSSQLDPEVYRDVVRAYQQVCSEVITRFDGHIAQLLGDGLLVYFGYPHAHEDDALRAVRAGLGILDVMRELGTRLQHDKGIQLAVRLGIHTGLVVIGDMGEAGRQEQLALGETPNIAARIQGLAPPHTLVVSEATSRLVEGYFTCESLGEPTLRGVSQSLKVYRVLEASGVTSRLDIVQPRGLTPLVGRESEVTLLLERWEHVKSGHGQVILLSGDAGIGKSRLVQMLKEHVANEPHTRWECRSSSYFEHTALFPVTDLFQRLLRFQAEDTPEEKVGKLEQLLSQYRLPVEESVPLCAPILSLALPENRYPLLNLSPQRQRQKTLEIIAVLLLEQAEQHPLLFIVEDLHWTDPTTLELLNLVIEQIPTTSILTVLTCRPHFQPTWHHRSYLTEITINRLSPTQVAQIVTRMTDGKTLPEEVRAQVIEKTDGVPLFVEEMTKTILESGHLKAVDDHYELTGSFSTLAIPATLQDSLMARLDRLVTAKAVAQYAAVIGRQFAYDLLAMVSQLDEATLQRELGRLVDAEIVYQRGVPPQATYTFKHALIQDVAYQSLLRSTRQQHHQHIAQVLETHFPDLCETQPELLAQHYTEAGLHTPAVAYWERAGRRASGRSAYVEAIGHLSKGLEVLKSMPNTAERARQELVLHTMLGPALMNIKGQAAPEVEQTYARARELCRQVEEVPQLFPVLWGLWYFYEVRAQLPTARELGEQLLGLAQSAQDTTLLLAAHRALGQNLTFLGELSSARTHLAQSITLYDPQQHRSLALLYGQDLKVVCQSWAALALWLLGYPVQALQQSQEAVTLAQELAHPYSLIYALNWATMLHLCRREEQAAHKRAEGVRAIAAELELTMFAASGMLWWGRGLAAQASLSGRLSEEGIARMHQGLDAWLATGAGVFQPYYLALLAEAYGASGGAEAGLHMLAEALTVVDKTAECFWEAELYRLKGELLLSRGAREEVHGGAEAAAASFHQALDIARRQEARSLELRAAMSLARLWQQQGKRQEAYDLLAPVYGWFTEGFDTADLQDAKALLEALA